MFIRALFGDSQVSFTPDGELYFHSGRNGWLHVKEHDGSVRGNHPYLSAVAVPRLVYPQAAWAAAMQQSQDAGNITPLAILREADHLLGQQDAAVAEAICLDVYECSSESAVPLPREAFVGPTTRAGAPPVPANTARSRGRPGNPLPLAEEAAVKRPTLTVRGQHQLSTLSGTDGNQPGITGKRPTARNQSPLALSRSVPAP